MMVIRVPISTRTYGNLNGRSTTQRSEATLRGKRSMLAILGKSDPAHDRFWHFSEVERCRWTGRVELCSSYFDGKTYCGFELERRAAQAIKGYTRTDRSLTQGLAFIEVGTAIFRDHTCGAAGRNHTWNQLV